MVLSIPSCLPTHSPTHRLYHPRIYRLNPHHTPFTQQPPPPPLDDPRNNPPTCARQHVVRPPLLDGCPQLRAQLLFVGPQLALPHLLAQQQRAERDCRGQADTIKTCSLQGCHLSWCRGAACSATAHAGTADSAAGKSTGSQQQPAGATGCGWAAQQQPGISLPLPAIALTCAACPAYQNPPNPGHSTPQRSAPCQMWCVTCLHPLAARSPRSLRSSACVHQTCKGSGR